MTTRCDLSDLPADQCACRIHAKPEQAIDPDAPLIRAGYGFEARFPGRCPECEDDIDPGMDICRTTDGEYVHCECVETGR